MEKTPSSHSFPMQRRGFMVWWMRKEVSVLMRTMTRETRLRQLLGDRMRTLPDGRLTSEITPEEFPAVAPAFFQAVIELAETDVSGTTGWGEFDDELRLPSSTLTEELILTFDNEAEGYWYHWRDMFGCTMLTEAFFEEIFARMLHYAPFCEGRRQLVNGSAYFSSMVTDGGHVAFLDWSRAGVMDMMLDFATMDIHRPYLRIPERLWDWASERGIAIPDFRERFLCMAYFRGIDSLRWHASIDDEASCASIIRWLKELEERVMQIGGHP